MIKRIILLATIFLVVKTIFATVEKSDTIKVDETWNEDTVKITGNILIDKGVTLTITQGVYVEFQGHYSIDVDGTILALGTISDSIKFDILPDSTEIGWNGFNYEYNIYDKSEFEYCSFNNSRSLGNGGVFTIEGFQTQLKFSNCIFKNNFAEIGGGAIYCEYSDISIENCTFQNNRVNSYYGGALYFYTSTSRIVGNVFIKNTCYSDLYYAESKGGAIYGKRSDLTILNNTFYKNLSKFGGALSLYETDLMAYNNIFWENTAIEEGHNVFIDQSSRYCNFKFNVFDNEDYGISGKPKTFVNNYTYNPNFTDTLNYDLSLTDSSLLINLGDPNSVDYNLPATDISGNDRIINSKVDPGAYEFSGQATQRLIITNDIANKEITEVNTEYRLGLNVVSEPAAYTYSFIEKPTGAIIENDTIKWTPTSTDLGKTFSISVVADNTAKRDTLTFEVYVLDENDFRNLEDKDYTWNSDTIRIYGDLTVYDGRVLTINPGVYVEFQDQYFINVQGSLVAQGTKTDSIHFNKKKGDNILGWNGILFDGTPLTNDTSRIEYCKFKNANTTRPGGVFYINSFSKLKIHNNVFQNNMAESMGGAIFLESSDIQIYNNRFLENKAFGYKGGAIYISNSTPDIINNLFVRNTLIRPTYSSDKGGAIYCLSTDANIINNTFVGNAVVADGGAIFLLNSTPLIINNIFWKNTSVYDASQIQIESGSPVIKFNCIQDGLNGIEGTPGVYKFNTTKDPFFADDVLFNLSDSSSLINSGTSDINDKLLLDFDLAGHSRIKFEKIDLGALEFQSEPKPRLEILNTQKYVTAQVDSLFEYILNISSYPLGYTYTFLSKPEGMKMIGDTIVWSPSAASADQKISVSIEINNTALKDTIDFDLYVCGKTVLVELPDENVIWDSDTIKIFNNLTIPDSRTLTINPGVYIEFYGHHFINVQGRILALGKEDSMITFTAVDTVLLNKSGGWHGIRFLNTPETNDTSKLNYCKLEYGFAYSSSKDVETNKGGAIYIRNLYGNQSKQKITNCIISKNKAMDHGGGIYCERGDVSINNCYIFNNEATIGYGSNLSGDGVAFERTTGNLSNTVVSDNKDQGVYVLSNHSAGDFKISNSTIVNNQYYGIHFQYSEPTVVNSVIWGNKYSYHCWDANPTFIYCNVEGEIPEGEGNINVYPGFRETGDNPYSLELGSSCINGGKPDWDVDSIGISTDIIGNERIKFGRIDIGAYEFVSYNGINNPFRNIERTGAVNFVIDSTVYVGLGNNSDSVMCNFWKYDLETDLWTEMSTFPGEARSEAVSFVIDGKAYVGLGRSGYPYTYYKDCYEYDPEIDEWNQVADFGGSARYNAVAFAIKSKGYVGTGLDATSEQKDFWKFDPQLNNWTQVSDISGDQRTGAVAFVINDKAYISGGQYFDGYSVQLSDVQQYDPATDTWQERIFADGTNLSFSDATSVVIGDKGYICYGNQSKIVSYDPASNDVTSYGDILSLGDNRFDPIAFILDSTAYFGLGYYGIFDPVYKNDILELDHLPTDIILSADNFDENSISSTPIGSFNTPDEDPDDTHTYSLVSGDGENDADNGNFSIAGNELFIEKVPDFETKNTYYIYVQTEDKLGVTYKEAFVLNVNDVNESPTDIILSADSIYENSSDGTVVGSFSAVDEDTGDTHNYSLTSGNGTNDTDNSSFVISGNDLQSSKPFNFETKNQYFIYVNTEDQDGESFSKAFVIDVVDVNENPSQITLSNNTIDENSPVNSVIGTFNSEDEDAGDVHTYSLVSGNGTNDAGNSSFTIAENELQNAEVFDFETQNEYYIFVETNDNNGGSYQKAFIVTVNDVTEVGIHELSLDNIKVYPNPTSGKVNVDFSDKGFDEVNLKVISSSGQVIYKQKTKQQKNYFDLSANPPGLYYILIETDNFRGIQKLILE